MMFMMLLSLLGAAPLPCKQWVCLVVYVRFSDSVLINMASGCLVYFLFIFDIMICLQRDNPTLVGLMEHTLMNSARTKQMQEQQRVMQQEQRETARSVQWLQQNGMASAVVMGQLYTIGQANLHTSQTTLHLTGTAASSRQQGSAAPPHSHMALPPATAQAGSFLDVPAGRRSKDATKRLRRELLDANWKPPSADFSIMAAPLQPQQPHASPLADSAEDGSQAGQLGLEGDSSSLQQEHAASPTAADASLDAPQQLGDAGDLSEDSGQEASHALSGPAVHTIPAVAAVEFVPGQGDGNAPWTQMSQAGSELGARFTTLSGDHLDPQCIHSGIIRWCFALL